MRREASHSHRDLERRIARIAAHGDACPGWSITPAELTQLAGWSRQRTWSLLRAGVLRVHVLPLPDGRRLVRIPGDEILSYLRGQQ